MSDYIKVTVMCRLIGTANNLSDTILYKRLAAGYTNTNAYSKCWIHDQLVAKKSYKLEFQTKKSLFEAIENEIRKSGFSDIFEVSYCEIEAADQSFFDWIEKNVR